MHSELLNLKSIARLTGTSEAFWRKQVALKAIPVVRIGRLVRLSAEDVRAFIEARKEPAGDSMKVRGAGAAG